MQDLFFYTKSPLLESPFGMRKKLMRAFFTNLDLRGITHCPAFDLAILKLRDILFNMPSTDERGNSAPKQVDDFKSIQIEFLILLDCSISHLSTNWKEQGVSGRLTSASAPLAVMLIVSSRNYQFEFAFGLQRARVCQTRPRRRFQAYDFYESRHGLGFQSDLRLEFLEWKIWRL